MKPLNRIFLLLLLLTSVLRADAVPADTFTPLVDGDTAAQTAVEAWAGYDPSAAAEPLETETLYEWEEDGVTLRVVRYRVGVFGGKTAMVAGIYGFPTGQSNLPGLVQIHGGGQSADYRTCLTNAKRGYATLSLAWAGRIAAVSSNDTGEGYSVTYDDLVAIFADTENFETNIAVTTDWGDLEGYHYPSRFNSLNFRDLMPEAWTIDEIESPRNSTWFLWTTAARRGLTFLEQQSEVDASKLGVYGHSMGGKLSVMTAGSDARVKAAAPSCGGVSDFNKEAFYDVTIGDPGYWDMISCPTFFLKPSNDFHAHIADVPTAVGVIGGNGYDWRVTTSPHGNHQDKAAYAVGTQIWMDQHLKSGATVPGSPELQIVLDDVSGVPMVSVTGDNTTRTIQSVDVYYTQQGEDAAEVHPFQDFAYRHWHYAAAQGSGANWTAALPIHDTDEPLWAFVNITYDLDAPITGVGYGYGAYTAEEFVISSPIAAATSAELQAAGVTATLPATTVLEDFQAGWEKEWFNYDNVSPAWRVATHKVNDPVYAAPQYAKLAFEVRSVAANTLVVRMNNAYAQIALPASPDMQAVEFQPADFKIGTDPWAYDWEGAQELEFLAWSWSGADPEFQNLRWEPGTRAEYDTQFTNKLIELTPVDGKYYLDLNTYEEVTEIYPSTVDAWFGDPGAPLVVDSVTYDRGLTMHAPAEVVYFLGSAFERFEAIATVSSVLDTPVQMKVYLDDVLAFDSGDLGNGGFAPVDIDVSDVSTMRLVVSYTDIGNGSNGAHASWVNAHLTLPPSGVEEVFYEDFEDSPAGAVAIGTSALNTGWTGTDFVGGGFTLDVVVENGTYSNANNNLPAANFVGGQFVGTLGYTQSSSLGLTETFIEARQYAFSFLHYMSANSVIGGRSVTLELYDADVPATVFTTETFAPVDSKDASVTRTLTYVASPAAHGKKIGLRLSADSVDYSDGDALNGDENNFYSSAVDNILLTASSESVVEPEVTDSDEMAYAGDVSDADLLHGITPSTTGVWVLNSAGRLNDGDHGRTYADAGTQEGAWTSVGATATFTIGTGANGTGYDIRTIQSIASWSGTFANQAWTVEVKSVGGDWVQLDTVDYQPITVGGATKVILSDPSGNLATGVEAIRFTANSVDGASNNGGFIWREIDVFGSDSAAGNVLPTIVNHSPDTVVDGSISSNVSTKTKLVAKFDSDIALGTGNITIVNLDTSAETVITLPDAQVSIDAIDGSLLLIEPSSELLDDTRYAVRIDATAIDALSGNSFAGIDDSETWTFTTRGEEPLKILCIGDSITVGYTDTFNDSFDFGYRGHLYNLMNDAGYIFQFVGESQQPWVNAFSFDPTEGGTYKPAFEVDLRHHDQDYHQGGEGASIGAITTWFQSPDVDPDLVLLKIGINSIQDGVEFSAVRDNIFDLVNAIMTQKPDAHVIVAQIIPYSGDYASWPVNVAKNQVLYQYNVYIRDTLSSDLAAAGRDVSQYSTVDQYSMYLTDPDDYTSAVATGRHSNNYNHPWNVAVGGAGYDVMAQNWFNAIELLDLKPEVSSLNELEYTDDVSDSDLLHGLTAMQTGHTSAARAKYSFIERLNDGEHGATFSSEPTLVIEATATTVGAVADFRLGYGPNGTGYDITSIQSIAAWQGGGFCNQAWTVDVKPVGGEWTTLETVDYQPISELAGTGATKVTLTDPSGVLATGIERIRFIANSVDNVVDSGAFQWRELDVFGAPSATEAVAPTLVSVSPDTVVDGSIRSNVSTGTKLVAQFDEAVELGTGAITIVNLDTLAETVITLPDAQVSIDPIEATLLMIEPSTPLLENTRYAVRIAATAIDDRSGNSFAGITDPVTWTFTTRASEPIKILCIGDSITVGYTDDLIGDPFNFGYRSPLYQLLNDAGYIFQYVGTSTQPWEWASNPNPPDATIGGSYKPAFDLRDIDQDYQQAGGGAPIETLIGWLSESEPDLILLKIGINSIQDGVTFETVRDYIYDLVDTAMTEKPNAHVIVAQILPYSGDYTAYPANEAKNAVLYQYNTYIRDTLSSDLATAGHDTSKFSTADMYSMFLTNPSDYSSAVADGRHSNDYNHPWNVAVDGAGYDVMAQQWFNAIEALNIGPDSFGFWLEDPEFGIDPSEQGFGDDPDGDGLASGLEAWLGTNPGVANTGGNTIFFELSATSDESNSTFVFSHPNNSGVPSDINVSYEWSMNLQDWYAGDGVDGPSEGPTMHFTPVTVNDSTTVTAVASEVLEKTFVRVSVSLQN